MRPRTLQCAELVRNRPGISRAEVAQAMGCALATAGQHLYDAKCAGLIASDGVGRYAGWHTKSRSIAASGGPALSSVWAMGSAV